MVKRNANRLNGGYEDVGVVARRIDPRLDDGIGIGVASGDVFADGGIREVVERVEEVAEATSDGAGMTEAGDDVPPHPVSGCIERLGPTTVLSVVRTEETMGLQASDTTLLAFDDMRLSRPQLIENQNTVLRMALEMVSEGLAPALKYSHERELGRGTVADIQGNQHALADMQIAVFASESMVYRTEMMSEAGLNIEPEASVYKVFATEVGHQVIDRANADAWRHRLHLRGGDRAAVPRSPRPVDLRGHERGPTKQHLPSHGASRARLTVPACF
jgi:hypothetical protein